MKKVFIGIILSVSAYTFQSFNSPMINDPEDFTRLEFEDDPVPDTELLAYDLETRQYVYVQICPGTGVRCSVKVRKNGVDYTVNDFKGQNRGSIEISD